MALIICNECGKEISDKADKCPECGFPLYPLSEYDIKTLKRKINAIEMASIIFAVMALFSLGYIPLFLLFLLLAVLIFLQSNKYKKILNDKFPSSNSRNGIMRNKKRIGCLNEFLVGVGIILLLVFLGNLVDSTDGNSNGSSEIGTPTQTEQPSETETPIKYTSYKVSDMMDELDLNAMNAENKYNDKYVKITGKLSNIDSDGKYIDLMPSNGEYALIGVQCYITSDGQTDKVSKMEKGDTVTLKGKITSIGEVMGYSLDITEIE